MFRFEDVWLQTGPSAAAKPILQGVNLAVPQSSFTVVIGPSGGGKSSLLRLFNRLESPDRGQIFFDGALLGTYPVFPLRRRVGLVSQKPVMSAGSVWRNLCQPLIYQNAPLPTSNAPELNDLLALCDVQREWFEQPARSLSGGQQQRVALARTLMNRPDVLLLDEPTAALDRPAALALGQRFRARVEKDGLTVVMATHDLELARRCADQVVFLDRGRVVEIGPVDQVLYRPKTAPVERFLADPAPLEVTHD